MLEFLLSPTQRSDVWLVILLLGVVTYITRSGGHIVLARFKTIHPRVEAALEAVPAAVLVTLVVPPALTSGPIEFIAVAIAFVASLRFPPLVVLAVGLAIVIAGRQVGF